MTTYWALIDGEVRPADQQGWKISPIARTEMGEIMVSTVFLGIGSLLFETMVFGGSCDQAQWRYASLAEARAGHERIVLALQEGQEP